MNKQRYVLDVVNGILMIHHKSADLLLCTLTNKFVLNLHTNSKQRLHDTGTEMVDSTGDIYQETFKTRSSVLTHIKLRAGLIVAYQIEGRFYGCYHTLLTP